MPQEAALYIVCLHLQPHMLARPTSHLQAPIVATIHVNVDSNMDIAATVRPYHVLQRQLEFWVWLVHQEPHDVPPLELIRLDARLAEENIVRGGPRTPMNGADKDAQPERASGAVKKHTLAQVQAEAEEASTEDSRERKKRQICTYS